MVVDNYIVKSPKTLDHDFNELEQDLVIKSKNLFLCDSSSKLSPNHGQEVFLVASTKKKNPLVPSSNLGKRIMSSAFFRETTVSHSKRSIGLEQPKIKACPP